MCTKLLLDQSIYYVFTLIYGLKYKVCEMTVKKKIEEILK